MKFGGRRPADSEGGEMLGLAGLKFGALPSSGRTSGVRDLA
jgi:hypothetical protein